jgi:hypothetical protein
MKNRFWSEVLEVLPLYTAIFLLLGGITTALFMFTTPPDAYAQSAPTTTRSTYPYGTAAKETPACASPCTVNATNVLLFNASGQRSTAVICNESTAVVYLCMGTSTCAGATAYDKALSAAVSANSGGGGCLMLGGQAGRMQQGQISAAGTSGAVSLYAY